MKRISTSTAVQNKFVDGNKSSGLKATQLNAEWFNQVQEEICKLLESAGIIVGADDADNQLMQLFTSLFVLQATLKSATCKKSFEGGYSTVAVDGEKISMSAAGDNVTDNSTLNVSRLLQKFQKSISGGGSLSTEVSPSAIVLKADGSGDAVYVVEIQNDRILFKSGDPLTERASIAFNATTNSLEVDFNGVVIKNDKISFKSGDPLTEHASITFNRTNNSLTIDAHEILFGDLINATGGVEGGIITDMIQPKTAGDPIIIGFNKSGTVTSGCASADRFGLTSTSHIKSSSDISLNIAANSIIESKVGDIVVVENTSGVSNIVVTMGTRAGSGGVENKEMSLPAYCSMAFICISFFKDPNTHAITSEWSPMSDVTVSWNTQGA